MAAIDPALFLQEAIIGFLVKAEWKPGTLAGEWKHADHPQPVTYMQAFELTTNWLFPDEPPAEQSNSETPSE